VTRELVWSPDPNGTDNVLAKVGPFTLSVWPMELLPGQWNWTIEAVSVINPDLSVDVAVAAKGADLRTESAAIEAAESALLAIRDAITKAVR
jgi:hypothetical protein